MARLRWAYAHAAIAADSSLALSSCKAAQVLIATQELAMARQLRNIFQVRKEDNIAKLRLHE